MAVSVAEPRSRVTIHMVASLDGFIARQDGSVDWLETSDEFAGGAVNNWCAMGKRYEGIDADLQAFIESQRMFFVATAPLDAAGHVNVSPKGLDTFKVLGTDKVAYLDHVGSGVETIAHLKENHRIVLMWCAFQGPPRIVRLHGHGDVLEPRCAEYQRLRPLFPENPAGRAIILVVLDRISDSCGFGVPLYAFEGERSQLAAWAGRKGAEGLSQYQAQKNKASIDGLPAVTWVPRNGVHQEPSTG